MLTIKDIIQSKSSAIWSISSHDSAYNAMQLMAEKNIGVLLVIDKKNVVGIISERDLARNVILKGLDSHKATIGKLMTRDIYCISPDKPVEECMAVMTTARIRHMPVFENRKLIGIVTFADIAKALLVEKDVTIQDLESYISCSESFHP